MSQSTTGKRDAQKRRRREQLLDVALELFAREGVEKTTVGRIAQEANVSHGLLYHYFSSKEEVLYAIIERFSFLPQLTAIFEEADGLPASEFLPEYVKRKQKLLEERSEAVWLLFVEARRNPQIAERLDQLGEKMRAMLAQYLQSRVEAGELRPHDTRSFSRALSCVIFMDHLWPIDQNNLPCTTLDFLLNGILKQT